MVHPAYHGTDIYNGCLLRLVKRINNTGPTDAVLYDWPLGWTDPSWAGCLADKTKAIDETEWRKVSRSYLSSHARYPKDSNQVPGSALQRALDTIDAFFGKCTAASCIPTEGLDLASYSMTDVSMPSLPLDSKLQVTAKPQTITKPQATAKPVAVAKPL
eukprot:jgi/Chrzof1/6356/Cz18g05150.t1